MRDRPDVVGDIVGRGGLDEHHRSAGSQSGASVPRRAKRIAHVVQTVEEADQVEPTLGVVVRGAELEGDAIGHPGSYRISRAASIDPAWVS